MPEGTGERKKVIKMYLLDTNILLELLLKRHVLDNEEFLSA
jgi:hypothetical protein